MVARLTVGNTDKPDLASLLFVLMQQPAGKKLGVVWMGTEY
jgi:hypothetical protein